MKQKILIIRSQDIFTDSRVLRYEEWFKKIILNIKFLLGIVVVKRLTAKIRITVI